jgi:small subunit ribosomal protein S18
MARNPKVGKKSQDRRPKPSAAGGRLRRGRAKVCVFCSEHATWVDYKDVALLRRFVNDRGRIRARGATGTCAQHQRDVAVAVKTARELALLPYSVRTVASESRGSRGGDRRGTGRGPAPQEGSGTDTPDVSANSGDPVDETDAGDVVDETEGGASVQEADDPLATSTA